MLNQSKKIVFDLQSVGLLLCVVKLCVFLRAK